MNCQQTHTQICNTGHKVNAKQERKSSNGRAVFDLKKLCLPSNQSPYRRAAGAARCALARRGAVRASKRSMSEGEWRQGETGFLACYPGYAIFFVARILLFPLFPFFSLSLTIFRSLSLSLLPFCCCLPHPTHLPRNPSTFLGY